MSDEGDWNDYRANAEIYKKHFERQPEIVAVYNILVAFNRHRHEGLPLSDVKAIYSAEFPKLEKYLGKKLRTMTEVAFSTQSSLSKNQYDELLTEWSMLRGYLEGGRSKTPLIIAAIILLLLVMGIMKGSQMRSERLVYMVKPDPVAATKSK